VNYELHLRLYISPLIGWGTVSVCGSIMKPAPVACNGSKATGLIVPFSAVHDILIGRRKYKGQKGVEGSKKDLSSLLDSDILYVVSLGDAPSSFFISSPVVMIAAGLFLCDSAWSHMLQKIMLPVSLCSDFYM
jgi:hypothetical protein